MSVVFWVASGWFFGFLSSNRGWWRRDPLGGLVVNLFCGAIVGPVGVFWLIGSDFMKNFNRPPSPPSTPT